jgi:hypothetical protein
MLLIAFKIERERFGIIEGLSGGAKLIYFSDFRFQLENEINSFSQWLRASFYRYWISFMS